MSRKKKTDLELLQILKKEIDRLEIEDNPSRTKMQEVYNKEVMPHPNTYVNRFCSWQKALQMIGIDYDGAKVSSESAKKHIKGKRYASTWSNMSKEEMIDAALAEIHHKGIRSALEYQNLRSKGNSPSLSTLSTLIGIKWNDLRRLYLERFNVDPSSTGFLNSNWADLSHKEIIDVVISEMKKIDSSRYVDYAKERDRENTPSVTTLSNRGISWSEVAKIYEGENKND